MKNIFNRVPKKVPNQNKYFCPFCESQYASVFEVRPFVECPACEGSGFLANIAFKEVDNLIENLDSYDLETVESWCRKLGCGIQRAEIRNYIRKKKGV